VLELRALFTLFEKMSTMMLSLRGVWKNPSRPQQQISEQASKQSHIMALLLIIQAVRFLRLPRQTPSLPLRRLPRNDSDVYRPTNSW